MSLARPPEGAHSLSEGQGQGPKGASSSLVIDVHGHYTTAPAALGAWRDLQIAGLKDPAKAPRPQDLKISDDDIRETIEWLEARRAAGA